MLLLNAFLISFVQFALCGLCGLGLALILPPPLRAQQFILAPVIGLACLAILGFYGTVAGLTLRQILPLALAFAIGSLAVALRQQNFRNLSIPPLQELLPLALIALGTWLLAVAPALSLHRLMPIGHGMDVEFYMGLAAYLKDYSYATLPQAPVGPIRDLLSNGYINQIAFGATYVQGMADLIGGWEAWTSWVPMQATLRVMVLFGLYTLLRGTLGINARGALAGTLLVGLNSLLLWLTYNNFSASLAGIAVFLAAIALVLLALEQGDRSLLLVGGLLIGGLACLYWPILTAFGTLFVSMGLIVFWFSKQRGLVVLRGITLLMVGALVGLLPNLRAPYAFPLVFAATNASEGDLLYTPAPVIAGLVRFTHLEAVEPTSMEWMLGWVGIVAALIFLGIGLGRGVKWRLPAITLGICALLYLLGLRFVIGYPYGYFRGSSYVAPILLGLVGAGLGSIELPSGPLPLRLRSLLAGTLGLIVLAATATAAMLTVRSYSTADPGYPAETNSLNTLVGMLTRPGPILFSSAAATALCGNGQGAWAYWLRDHELLGDVRATFSESVNPRGSTMPAYGVIMRGEDPAAHGLAPAPLWQDDQVLVYATSPGTIAWLTGLDPYMVRPACAYKSSNSFRAGLGLGNYAAAQPGQPLVLNVSPDTLSLTALQGVRETSTRSLQLALASFVTQTATLNVGSDTRRITLTPGLNFYNTGSVTTPLSVSLRPETDSILLDSAELADVGPPMGMTHDQDLLLLGVAAHAQNDGLTLDLQVHNQSNQALRLALEVYEDVTGYQNIPTHYAGGIIAFPSVGTHQLTLDLQIPAARLDSAVLPLTTIAPGEGRFFVALWVYQGEQVRRTIPVAVFERRNGLVRDVRPLSYNAIRVPIGTPAKSTNVVAGNMIRLSGYEISRMVARPRETVRVSLLWHGLTTIPTNYMVFVQLLDARDTKAGQWDGAAGGDWIPTAVWRPNQTIWQDVPLVIAPDAKPGRYRVVVGIYDPTTGIRLPLSSGGNSFILAEVEIAAGDTAPPG